MSRHFRTSILTVDRVGHAQEIVDVAEEELRRTLTDGERRDLLADNTDWPFALIEGVVEKLGGRAS